MDALHGDPFPRKGGTGDIEVVAELDVDLRDGILVHFTTGPACESFEELLCRDEEARNSRFEVRCRLGARVRGLRVSERISTPVKCLSFSLIARGAGGAGPVVGTLAVLAGCFDVGDSPAGFRRGSIWL